VPRRSQTSHLLALASLALYLAWVSTPPTDRALMTLIQDQTCLEDPTVLFTDPVPGAKAHDRTHQHFEEHGLFTNCRDSFDYAVSMSGLTLPAGQKRMCCGTPSRPIS